MTYQILASYENDKIIKRLDVAEDEISAIKKMMLLARKQSEKSCIWCEKVLALKEMSMYYDGS